MLIACPTSIQMDMLQIIFMTYILCPTMPCIHPSIEINSTPEKQNDQQLELSELHSKIGGTVVGELKDTENHIT